MYVKSSHSVAEPVSFIEDIVKVYVPDFVITFEQSKLAVANPEDVPVQVGLLHGFPFA
jgi:hypothetical protein